MPRERAPMRQKAVDTWLASGKTAKNRDVATELGVSEKTVSGWKSRDKWGKKTKKVRQTRSKVRQTRRHGSAALRRATRTPRASQPNGYRGTIK